MRTRIWHLASGIWHLASGIWNRPPPPTVYAPVDSLRLDLRYALRSLLKRPGFSALAILTLAVGIGVNAVAFSAVSALLFKPFSFDGVGRLGWIMSTAREDPYGQLSWTGLEDVRRASAFDAVAAETRMPLAWQDGGRARQVWGLLVTSNYFLTLNARPEQGRLLVPADASGSLAIVVSHRFGLTQLGGGSLIGRTITLNQRSCTIVGVLPDGFQGPGGLYEPDVWMPLEQARNLRFANAPASDEPTLTLFARLRDSVTAAHARAELDGIARTLTESVDGRTRRGLAFHPMAEGHPELRRIAPIAWLALSVVGIVLLIACFNVASLLLARAAERRREMIMRAALGAGRWRIVQQLLAEGAVLSLLAGGAALALANWSGRLLAAFSLPAPIPQRLHMRVDARVIGFTLAMVAVATVLPSLLPAWHATRRSALRVQDRQAGSRRIRSAFLVAQIAGSTVFLAAALLFVRSFWNAASLEPGFDTAHTVVAEVSPYLYGYDASRSALLAETAVSRLAALEGVRAASVAARAPYGVGFGKAEKYSVSEDCSTARCPSASAYRVGPGYLRSLGVPVLEGRDLRREDGESAVVINAELARRLWAGRSAVGQALRIGENGRVVDVVGVAGDVKLRSLSETPAPVIYRLWRGEDSKAGLSFVVRASGDARAILGSVRETLSSIDRGLPLQSLQTMSERMELPLWPSRTLAGFFAICGTLSIVLAAVGLFGVTYYLVQQRTREFGVRIALGATRHRMVRLVLGEGVRVALIGTTIGAGGAIVTARLLGRALVDLSPGDPLTYGLTAALQIAVALAACALPAWRASQADPIGALRAE